MSSGRLLATHSMTLRFTSEWSRQYGIHAEFHAVPNGSEETLPGDLETSLYRILQEALNNILKHASAKNVSVLYHRSTTGISLIIEDDGCGFNTDIALRGPGAGGLGVVGMRERAELLGGTLDVESFPGKGTTVVCRVPFKPQRRT